MESARDAECIPRVADVKRLKRSVSQISPRVHSTRATVSQHPSRDFYSSVSFNLSLLNMSYQAWKIFYERKSAGSSERWTSSIETSSCVGPFFDQASHTYYPLRPHGRSVTGGSWNIVPSWNNISVAPRSESLASPPCQRDSQGAPPLFVAFAAGNWRRKHVIR